MDALKENAELRDYAATQLGKPSFSPSSNDDGEFFALSLASAQAFLCGGVNLENAYGQNAKTAFGYIDAVSPNAFADRHGSSAIIGLHTGLIAAVFEFGQFVFTQSDFFPNIGHPQLETNPKPKRGHPPGFWTAEAGGVLSEKDFQDGMISHMPICDERRHAGIFLSHFMARFAWFHEHFHIVNGHVDWLAEKQNHGGLTEFIEERSAGRPVAADIIRYMEFDADRSAFHALCHVQIGGVENITGIAALPQSLRVRMSLFAAYAMTWLFDAYGRRNTGFGHHPDPYLRLHNLMRTLASNIAPDLPGAATLNRHALFAFEALRPAIPDLPEGGRIFHDFMNTDIQSTLNQAEIGLDQMRRKWAPFQLHSK